MRNVIKICLVGLLATHLAGCAVASQENGKNTVTSVGSGCSVNVLSDTSYQVACTATDTTKITNALNLINKNKATK